MSRGRRLPKVLTEDEQERICDQFNTRYRTPHRDRTMIQLALATGLRAGEIVALKDEHVELDATGGRIVVREGKGHKDRVVYFGPEVRDALRKWLDRKPESEFVFPTRTGKPVATSHLRRVVKRAARDADVAESDRVSPHTLRHTFATDLYRETGKLRVVQEALGHESVQTTQLYAHLANGEVEESMRALRSEPEPEAADEDDEVGPDLAAMLEGASGDELREALVDELISKAPPELVREAFMRVVA